MAVVFGNKIFRNLACKWNPKARQFENDRSKLNFVFRCLHLIVRMALVSSFTVYGILCKRSESCSHFEVAFYVTCPIFFMASIVINLRTFFHPGLIPTLLNAIKNLNERYGKTLN